MHHTHRSIPLIFNSIIDKPFAFLSNIFNTLNVKGLLLMNLSYLATFYDKTTDNK
jgi:hypothetical protein